MKFFPNFFLRELMVWYGVLAVLGSLAAIFPWELGEKADPFASAPAGIRPEWYFLAQFYTLKLIPSHVWIFEGELLGLARIRPAGAGLGGASLLGHHEAGWSGRARVATGVGIFLVCYLAHLHSAGVLQMRALCNFSSLVPRRVDSTRRRRRRGFLRACHAESGRSRQRPGRPH